MLKVGVVSVTVKQEDRLQDSQSMLDLENGERQRAVTTFT